ncbi:MAG: hypothetical protein U0W40_04730 [Acidimicrobiia bacterium]
MSHFGDDVYEMPRRRPIDDDAVELVLAGVPAGDDLAGLTAFVDDVRSAAATGPDPVPSAALAHVLTRGFSTDEGDLPATAASNANGSAQQTAGLPKWRSALMKTSQFVAGLSMAAKVALGAGVAVAATATGAVAGVLPDPVQHAVADAVGSVTPFELPGASSDAPTADGANPGPATPPATDGNGAPGAGTGGSPRSGSGSDPGAPAGSQPATGAPGAPSGETGNPAAPPATEAPAAPPVVTPGPVDEPKVPQSLSISCAADGGHVHCTWTGANPETFGQYVLLRIANDGSQGRALTSSTDLGFTSWDDSLALNPGVTYGYMVIVLGPDGKNAEHSQYVYVTP